MKKVWTSLIGIEHCLIKFKLTAGLENFARFSEIL